ncbi:carbohydrate porin [Oscillatoria sp. FACHB-1407]|uniref:iron uptake porin n=1 Tax=Oscillatoria sp. FACHB-1407 TaxID=2692847 RepID=UPI0016866D40|nr:iron uptake porin [Oscillatoria sp. FACHB-1407]MBD2462950.1 carbohydrate porin [Oscillatoria sp. FACHB-1407]
MHKYSWYFLLISSAVAVLHSMNVAPAFAEEVTNDTSVVAAVELNVISEPIQSSLEGSQAVGATVDEIANVASIEPVETLSVADPLEAVEEADIAQVTSVSQLSDVEPTDWAFQALQSLVERYGCIAGYPDGTYRGDRTLTRYEFAAGLNACLDRVNELISTGLTDAVTAEDLETIQRLQEEFSAELASLRGRIDALEARTAELEANQFSTTTVLRGLTWFNLTGAFADGDVLVETSDLSAPPVIRPAGRDPVTGRPLVATVEDDPEITFSYLTWLTLSTSFNGEDNLVTQLAVGNGDSPANAFVSAGLYNTFGVPFTDQTAQVDIGSNDVIIRELFYSFPINDSLQAVVGPRINWYRYFDNNRFTFFLTGASSFNSGGSTLLNTIDRGSGAALLWQINEQFRLNVAYLGESDEFLPSGLFNTSSNPDEGLFGGTNTITAEVTFSPSSDFNLRLLYNRSNLNAVFGQVGGAPGEPIYGLLDDGAGGPLNDATADTFSANFDWLITPTIGIFGRYTYGITHIEPGDVDAQAVQAGIAFLDFLKEGSQLTLSYMIPFSVLDGHEFLVSGGGDGGVQYEFELTYFYPLTDNIALVPAFYVIGNANNFDSNPTIYVGNLRTQFSF